jgi:hypothetical protein
MFSILFDIGEANAGGAYVKYNCLFTKMIQSWRETWNERTNGTTDIQFPFGFVQVSLVQNRQKRFFPID